MPCLRGAAAYEASRLAAEFSALRSAEASEAIQAALEGVSAALDHARADLAAQRELAASLHGKLVAAREQAREEAVARGTAERMAASLGHKLKAEQAARLALELLAARAPGREG